MVRPAHDPEPPTRPWGVERPRARWREDPLGWSIPLFTVARTPVRAHLVFVLYVTFELVLSVSGARLGPSHVAIALLALIANVLVRELARALVARALGAEPVPVMLWPLGSLSSPHVHAPRTARLAVALAGSAIGLAIAVSLGGVLMMSGTATNLILFNPLDPAAAAGRIGSLSTLVLWWAYAVTVIVSLVNLIPMFPLDAGRVIEAAIGQRAIARAGSLAATKVGMVVALVVFVAAMTASSERLMGVAAFAFMVCWFERRRAEFIADPLAPDWHASQPESASRHADDLDHLDDLMADLADMDDADDPEIDDEVGPSSPSTSAGPARVDPEAELDAILAKISREGLEALSPVERSVLDAARVRKLRDKPGDRHGDRPD